jgi:uncharacterized membrane protein YeaQ/YmgE (transglycosylase-associated protein family)
VHVSDERVIVILVVGAIAGLLANKLLRGASVGMIGDSAIGIVGALLGEWLLPRFHFHIGGGLVGEAVSAAIGSAIVVLIVRASGASGWGAGR